MFNFLSENITSHLYTYYFFKSLHFFFFFFLVKVNISVVLTGQEDPLALNNSSQHQLQWLKNNKLYSFETMQTFVFFLCLASTGNQLLQLCTAFTVYPILVTVWLFTVMPEVCRWLTNEKQRKTDIRLTDQ